MNRPAPAPLYSAAEIDGLVTDLGRRIAADHPDGVVLVGILNAVVPFMADLVRVLAGSDVGVQVDFLATSSFRPDSGQVQLRKDLDIDIGGRDVVLVSTLVDTGLRLGYLRGRLAERGPRRLRVAALFDKVERRILPVPLDYVGASVDARFLVGYGLDLDQRHRNRRDVAAVVDGEVGSR